VKKHAQGRDSNQEAASPRPWFKSLTEHGFPDEIATAFVLRFSVRVM
jgi:hypothetical protein